LKGVYNNMLRRISGVFAACAIGAATVLGTGVPAQAADPVITIDPTPAWASVYANNPPVHVASTATSLDVTLPPDASAVLGKTISTTLDYEIYNSEAPGSVPLFSGTAEADPSSRRLSITIPQGFDGVQTGSLQYCHDSTGNCGASPAAPEPYTGLVLVIGGQSTVPQGKSEIFVQSALTLGGAAGPISQPIDLGLPQALPLTFFIQKESTTALGSYTDKLVFRGVPGYFTSGPDGTWPNAFPYGFLWKKSQGISASRVEADVAYSADGRNAVATVPTGSIPAVCAARPDRFTLGVGNGESDIERYALADVALGSPSCIRKFSDVPVNSQFYREIQWLSTQKITTGYPNGSYGATLPVHRDAMAAFLYRLAGSPSWTPPQRSPFVDMTPRSAFYKEVTWLAAVGVTTGWVDGQGRHSFRPGSNINRDAMAAFLYRFSGEPSWTPPRTSPFRDLSPRSAFYKEITWLAETEITTGYSDHTYRPLSTVNRDAMAAFLYRWHTGLLLGTP